MWPWTSTSRFRRHFGQKNRTRVTPRVIVRVFQLESSCPQVVHFLRNLTVVPSWPTITAPFPAVARARRDGGRFGSGAGPSEAAGAGSAATAGGAGATSAAAAGGNRPRTAWAGTPPSTSFFHTVSVGRTSPAA